MFAFCLLTCASVSLVAIQTGKTTRIGGWHLAGDTGVPTERLLRALPRRGTALSQTTVDRAAATILSLYDHRGYPFCAATPLTLTEQDGFVYPGFRVTSGPEVRVSYLEFIGGKGVKARVLERVTGFEPAGYSPARLSQWRRRLEQSGLVAVDSEAIVRRPGADTLSEALKADAYGVRFWVTARRVNRASGVVGYSPEDRRLTGLLQVTLRNLFDTGRRLEAGWRRAYSRTSYNLSYTEPWVLGTKVDVTAGVRQQTEDTTSAQTNLNLAASAGVAAWTTLGLETGYDRFSDVAKRTNVRSVWAGTGVTFDSRDLPANPRRGTRLSTLTKVGRRTTDSAQGHVVAQVELSLSEVLPISRSLAWLNTLGFKAAYSGASLTEPERYQLGGAGTLRGYREEQFVSTHVGWFATEPRYLPESASCLYPFFDVGVYQDSLGWQVKPGYGAGARIGTRSGVFALDYGIAWQDSPLRGKVHLGYEIAF
ncbi:hypothetical protein FJY70_00740 [candidate division WOR-3 bacterium]|nr:hypothetical protein [candidate division WOR-3 bacterium]